MGPPHQVELFKPGADAPLFDSLLEVGEPILGGRRPSALSKELRLAMGRDDIGLSDMRSAVGG